ncbi:YlzJ-like family protein [Natranaerobius trueperi]|uniref:Uncharacterized protein n=1 Tax=Natranaerobius trueperi TaxID=759412 RepID=A0A226BZE2_9FIRM|nr:YlzJ-like family protein [Natranaerobius trueperi]OWZ84305.1 hypothetical protein CDO51_04395 [Natranaerobius trueperi]
MILYTPVALEDVHKGQSDNQQQFHEIEHKGRTVIVEPVNSFQGKVVRLISTDPNDFLDPTYQPGNMISIAGI